MAIRHLSTQLCDYVIRSDQGRFTLVGIYQNLRVKKFPAGKNPFWIYLQLQGDPEDEFQVLVVGPRGFRIEIEPSKIGSPPADLAKHQEWSVQFAASASVGFMYPGNYSIVLKSGGRTVHKYPFGVHLVPEDAEP